MTGSTRCYKYDLTSEDKAEMSTYKQQLWGYYNRALKAGNIRYISGPGKFGEFNPQIVSGNYGITYNGLSFFLIATLESGVTDTRNISFNCLP